MLLGIIVITCSSSCSSVGKRRPDERIPANSWSVRKTKRRTFAVAWTRGRVPSPAVPAHGLAFSCLWLPRAPVSVTSLSVPYLASRGTGSTGAAVPEQNPREESLLEHHHTWEALALLNSASIAWLCFLKAQEWDSPVNRMWGGEDAAPAWLLPWMGAQQSTRGMVTVMRCILNTHCAVLTTNSLHSGKGSDATAE